MNIYAYEIRLVYNLSLQRLQNNYLKLQLSQNGIGGRFVFCQKLNHLAAILHVYAGGLIFMR